MVSFLNVSEIIPPHSGLQVCVADTKPVKVLQWQCRGELAADLERGVYTDTQIHMDKANDFLRLAKDMCADLVLTPEYSFPCETLDAIILDSDLWPEKGTLWCLGMQGYSRVQLSGKLEEWTSTGNTLVIFDAFERIVSRQFVDALIYLFVLDDNRLCILPQFKTTPMSDKWNEYEGGRLCTSELIYIFDLCGSSDDLNRFLSILCSDALGVRAQDILDQTIGKHLILFHPQLNQNPRHSDFRSFRSEFFNRNAGRDVRLITLNWAEGTVIEDLSFDTPWSAFYKKTDRTEIAEQRLRTLNQVKGTYYTLHQNYTEIWYSHREEHCKQFDINKGYKLGVSYASIAHHEPNTQDYFLYNASVGRWHSLTERSCSLAAWMESHGEDYDFPLNAAPHESDAFFGLCFGHFLEGELKSDDNELVSRLFSGSDHESDRQRKAKASRYKKLIELIKRQDFPPELAHLKDNHMFYLDEASAEDKLKYGNVYPKDVEPDKLNPFLSALMVISEYTDKEDVEMQVDMLCKRLRPNLRDRMVAYYFSSASESYECYDDHLMQTRIDKATFSKSLSSIKG